MKHEHKPKHRSVTDTGQVFEVCECGATRVYNLQNTGVITKWHTCNLCTHPFGLESK